VMPPLGPALGDEKVKDVVAYVRSLSGLPNDNLKAQLGKEVFMQNCAACHGPEGKGVPGAFPALDGSKVVNGPVKDHLHRVMFGKEGTAMAAFGKQLSAADIAAVVTFERNSWSNRTNDVIQPAAVVAAGK